MAYTLYIFAYGEDQYIDTQLNKKFICDDLQNHDLVISSLNIPNYKIITYRSDNENNIFVNYNDGQFGRVAISTDANFYFDNLASEIKNK